MRHIPLHRDRDHRSVSQHREAHAAARSGANPNAGDAVPLAAVRAGQTAEVSELSGGRGFMGRLACLGFTPGATVTMIQNYGHGPLIVEMRGARIALGRGEAGRILVSRVSEP